MTTNHSSTATEIWAVADLLRGDFKQSQYGRVFLPFALLRRLECVLAATKNTVLAKVPEIEAMPIEVQGPLLLREASSDGTPRHFYNTSAMDLSKLGETGTADNLEAYLNAFSDDAREIFEHFRFNCRAGISFFNPSDPSAIMPPLGRGWRGVQFLLVITVCVGAGLRPPLPQR
jgi:type I restriction enzyme M protein